MIRPLQLHDLTTRGYLNVALGCPAGAVCTRNSAEVIAEDPGTAVPAYDLAASVR